MHLQLSSLKGSLKALWSRFRGTPPVRALIHEQYVRTAPSPQNALDIFAGEWTARLPGNMGQLRAGTTDGLEDGRIAWAAQQFGGLEGKRVLELGPLEGFHTYALEMCGPAEIIAVEANTRAFLKCLIVKEVLGLRRARFLCGDLVEYLRSRPGRFDAVVASGVLYHLRDPVEALALIAEVTDRLLLWTHYYDADFMARTPHLDPRFGPGVEAEHRGFRHTLYRYEYNEGLAIPGFSGGNETWSHWLGRADILRCLDWLGFGDVRIHREDPTFAHGPFFSLAAIKA